MKFHRIYLLLNKLTGNLLFDVRFHYDLRLVAPDHIADPITYLLTSHGLPGVQGKYNNEKRLLWLWYLYLFSPCVELVQKHVKTMLKRIKFSMISSHYMVQAPLSSVPHPIIIGNNPKTGSESSGDLAY